MIIELRADNSKVNESDLMEKIRLNKGKPFTVEIDGIIFKAYLHSSKVRKCYGNKLEADFVMQT